MARRRSAALRNALTEGGAEAFDRILAKRLGIPYAPPSRSYARWARKARRKGRRYVLKGQFR